MKEHARHEEVTDPLPGDYAPIVKQRLEVYRGLIIAEAVVAHRRNVGDTAVPEHARLRFGARPG